jgi:hypothetical protein
MDCGAAMVASEAEVSYERARASIAPDVCAFGMYYAELLHALIKITKLDYRLTIKPKPENLAKYLRRQKLKTSEIYLCERTNITNPLWRVHYVGMDCDENLYDPLEQGVIENARVISDYHKEWNVLGVIRKFIK